MGQIVQNVKDNVSQAFAHLPVHYWRMSEWITEADFNEAFVERVRALRDGKGWSAKTMAKALGIPAERYRKYENRSMMPLYLLERFAIITGCDLEYLLTGAIERGRRTGTNG